jgi:hypothetical protein
MMKREVGMEGKLSAELKNGRKKQVEGDKG